MLKTLLYIGFGSFLGGIARFLTSRLVQNSFASAFPAHIYTAFWIYMIIPFAGMLAAAELYVMVEKMRRKV